MNRFAVMAAYMLPTWTAWFAWFDGVCEREARKLTAEVTGTHGVEVNPRDPTFRNRLAGAIADSMEVANA